jgi:translocator protein
MDDTEAGRRYGLLALSLVAVAVVSAVGGLTTDTGEGSWYGTLEQPWWNPPDWVFGPVWTALYLAMAVAAWMVARQGTDRAAVRAALAAYGVQLALNLAWTLVFFGAESAVGGVVVIVALWVAIIATALLFARVHRVAALLLVPYLAWVTYAGALTWAIWRLE